jgi:hypothetical protein
LTANLLATSPQAQTPFHATKDKHRPLKVITEVILVVDTHATNIGFARGFDRESHLRSPTLVPPKNAVDGVTEQCPRNSRSPQFYSF